MKNLFSPSFHQYHFHCYVKSAAYETKVKYNPCTLRRVKKNTMKNVIIDYISKGKSQLKENDTNKERISLQPR